MRTIIFATAIAVVVVMPAQAEERTALPEIIVGAPPPNAPTVGPSVSPGAGVSRGSPERCDGGSGSERSLGCLNQKLKQEVNRVNPPVTNTPPIDAKSSDPKIGVVNIPGVQQQYGRNFGVSVYPYRPPAPVYVSPLGHR
ncbi:hypothetical protein [Bradyrhizobium prioriisuperbiae]|uniref:hypothetical protein n=1 Tax=Bradyrhizobium prioriisuperbiae TaxID=2854389 RepID=UPI0028E8E174|nr:hypothetical protein [Bradyrhizobium prioritasuperba]